MILQRIMRKSDDIDEVRAMALWGHIHATTRPGKTKSRLLDEAYYIYTDY